MKNHNHGIRLIEIKSNDEVAAILIPLLEKAEDQKMLAKELLDRFDILTADLLGCVDNLEHDKWLLYWGLDPIGRLYVSMRDRDNDG